MVLREVARRRNDRLGPDDPQDLRRPQNLLGRSGRGAACRRKRTADGGASARRSRTPSPNIREHFNAVTPARLHAGWARRHGNRTPRGLPRRREACSGSSCRCAHRAGPAWLHHPPPGQVEVEQLWGYVDTMRVRLGDDHPATLTAQWRLAGANSAEGLFEEGLEVLEALLADRVRVLGRRRKCSLLTG